MADTEQTAFTQDELNAFTVMAPWLRPNPRHLKRMINVYRLVRTLAQRQADAVVLGNPTALVTWLVISAQWPCIAYTMLWQLEKIEENLVANQDASFPERPPLRYLMVSACTTIESEQRWLELQTKLDDDVNDLIQLILDPRISMTWQELLSIRRYTIHFNPAVEVELRLSRPSEIESLNNSQPDEAT